MRGRPTPDEARDILATADASLLDVIDNLLNKGVVVTGDVILGLAGIDLVYVRLSALLCAADRIVEKRESA
jgi:gas vesicle protein GvpA/GvpJ/GvpM family